MGNSFKRPSKIQTGPTYMASNLRNEFNYVECKCGQSRMKISKNDISAPSIITDDYHCNK
jgi:hypothetical protein